MRRPGSFALPFLLSGVLVMTQNTLAAEFDPARLAALEARIRSGEIAGVHGVIVRQHGQDVAEWYFDGEDEAFRDDGPVPLGKVAFNAETLHDVRSVTKSVVSLLFGIALADKASAALDAPVLDGFPEYAALRTPERVRIRVRDVLSMTSGWHWDEWTYPYTDARNSEIAMDIAPDPHRYVLEQAIDVPPGTRWTYSGGDVALVGAIVARAARMPINEFARTRLFEPMGIRFEWSSNHVQGMAVPRAASGLRLAPRDMAKLGQLVLQHGRWGERQLVPADWIARATAHQAALPGGEFPGGSYGYLWWRGTEAGHAWVGAIGNGGQRIWMVPSLDLVLVMTAGNYNTPTQGVAPDAILAAVLAAATP